MRLYMPTKVFFGSGCVSENGAELKALGSRAMIVTGNIPAASMVRLQQLNRHCRQTGRPM